MATAAKAAPQAALFVPRWLRPSLADVLFTALFAWMVLYSVAPGMTGLLMDSTPGIDIRTGQYILETGTVPRVDLYSFSKPGHPWFAWEWLTDVILALTYSAAGLKGLILLMAAVIASSVVVMLRHVMWRGSNALVAIVVLHAAIGASSVHYLARPHAWTLLFFAISWWVLDRDRSSNSWHVWLLAPLTVLWANLHGGFLALPITLAILCVGSALEWKRAAAVRYGSLAVCCLAGSLLNPYGYHLFEHMLPYLNASWIREQVQEFQPLDMRSEAGKYFEVMLLLGVGSAAIQAVRKEYASAMCTLAWAHAALTSARHVPIFVLVAMPGVCTLISEYLPRPGILKDIARDFRPALAHSSVWMVALPLLLAFGGLGIEWPQSFPADRHPVALMERNADALASSRLLTTDGWAGYLLFRNHPRQKVYLDARSDFYGEQIVRDYVQLFEAKPGWRALLAKYQFDAVLAPRASQLSEALSREPGWKVVDSDELALLLKGPGAAEGRQRPKQTD